MTTFGLSMNALALAAGAALTTLGIGSFLLPNHFVDGGMTGLSMLLATLTGWPLPLLLVAANAPFLVLGYRHVGRAFVVRSALAISGVALAIAFVPFPVATTDKLLGAVFGGGFVGAGVGLAIRCGGVLDGTEILAVVLSKRTFATVGEIILAMNAVLFGVAACFLGLESALYSVLTYFAATKMIDYLLHGLEAYNGVLIVSPQFEAIRAAILADLGRGVTVFKSKGGFSDAEQDVLFCVVTRLELTKLEGLVKAIDPTAFIVVQPVHETSGGVVTRRAHM